MAQDLVSGLSGGSAADMDLAFRVANSMETEKAEWIAKLRAQGVKAAHPYDGWVDRKNNTVHFAYPQFDDGVQIGDLIALGWPQWSSREPQHFIVRVVGETDRYSHSWVFEPANV